MEKNQNASGITLLPARSLAIHCTAKRTANMSWATTAEHQPEIELGDEYLVKEVLISGRSQSASIDSVTCGTRLLRRIQPPHAEQIEDADPEPVPQP